MFSPLMRIPSNGKKKGELPPGLSRTHSDDQSCPYHSVGLVGALFGSFFSLTAVAIMWFYDMKPRFRIAEKRTVGFWLLVALNSFIVVAGLFIMVGGTYGSIVSIIAGYEGGRPWSCADNSGSV